MAMNNQPGRKPGSMLHAILSFFVPGLGQFIAGQRSRGISIILSFLVLGWLSIWTIAQRARFPDLDVSRQLFIFIYLQTLALMVFAAALRYLLLRRMAEDASTRTIINIAVGLVYAFLLLIVQDRIFELAGPAENLSKIYGGTALFAAAALSAFHMWNVVDGGQVGARPAERPAFTWGIAFLCLVIFSLGWNITKIDMQKAIAEYKDTQVILGRIAWPWRAAFEYEDIAVETTARVQAPCPEGATGPPVNEPVEGEAWISVTPTCGDISTRELSTGGLTFGTELTITGGNFTPEAEVDLLWKNPIGNPFRPRGVGETTIQIDENGEFVTNIFVPEVIIPSTAVGDQVHTLIIREESGKLFTGNLSEDIELALQGMLETIMIGLMATFFGVILAFPFSFIAARNLMEPISGSFIEVVGGLVGLIPAGWLLVVLSRQASVMLGGLADAPIQVAGVSLLLLLLLWILGWRLGTGLFRWVGRQTAPFIGRLVTAVGIGLLAAAFGYILGIGFTRGIVSIPLAGVVPENLETRNALIGAASLGLLAALYGYRIALNEFSTGMVVYSIARTIMNIVRSIEPLIWAIIGTIWVGLGPFAGTIALTLHTIAALGKLYSESIESIDQGPIEALQATGASRLQTIVYAVVPQILPPFISFTIYRWDINVRMSTIIGAVGGGGIGFILIQWIRLFNYESAGLAVWLITITVATLDYVSSNIRERFI